jgi:hypothetical protein
VTVIALFAATVWGAATPEAGRYSGSVDPFKLSFVVKNGKITDLVTDFEATTCAGLAAAQPSPSFGFPVLAIENGHFAGSETLHYRSGLDPHFTITGTFRTPTRAGGRLHEHISVPAGFGAPSCTLSQPFSVTRVR